ncbi:MAG: endolytic transglycosylase MltG [Treponema sp.]|nr:endolytic transglycosylase MltG [Treponema sp.]
MVGMIRVLKMIGLCMGCLMGMGVLFSVAAVGGFMYLNAPPESLSMPDDRELGLGRTTIDDPVKTTQTCFFEVYTGESAMSVGRRLKDAGMIRSHYFWYILSRLDKGYIKAGTYRLELPASQMAIRSILVTGQQFLTRVTIPEGVTLKKIAKILEAAEICDEDAFLTAAGEEKIRAAYQIPGETMEGFLYPDTYFFPRDYPASLVVKAMADTFFRRIAALPGMTGMVEVNGKALSPEELYQKVIIASIVEREYRVDEEAALMAGVFYNRLDIGMALQSCATVEYVITEIQGRPHPEILYSRDTEIQDPYNTYMRRGLPPGPISAPGAVALNAAFNPIRKEYLYFRLVDSTAGRHYFSRTFDDHIRAGALYVKGRSSS